MFFKSIHKRIKIVLLIIVFLFVVVILKVGYIQLFQYEKLNNLATDLWSRNLPIEAGRGIIYDVNTAQFSNMVVVVGGVIVFICLVVAAVIWQFIKLKRNT